MKWCGTKMLGCGLTVARTVSGIALDDNWSNVACAENLLLTALRTWRSRAH